MKKITKTFTIAIMCLISILAFTGCDWFAPSPKEFAFDNFGLTIQLDTSFTYHLEEVNDDPDYGQWGELWIRADREYLYRGNYWFYAYKDTKLYFSEEEEINSLPEFAENMFVSEGIGGAALEIEEYEDENTSFYYSVDDHIDSEGDRMVYFNIVMEGEDHFYSMFFWMWQDDYNEVKLLDWAKTIRVA